MTKHIRWETKPLECVDKAKEIRHNYFQTVWRAKEEGKLLFAGDAFVGAVLCEGFAPCEFLDTGPYEVTLTRERDLAARCAREFERRGYSRDLCSTLRLTCGSMFLNESPFGPFPKPDLFFGGRGCDFTHGWAQIMAGHWGIPYFCVDHPFPYKPEGYHVEYYASQLNDFIEWVEKQTGRKCDDEKMIEAIKRECRTRTLWARICELNQTIPAPLSLLMLMILIAPIIFVGAKPGITEYYQEVYEEIRERVKNKIAYLATERRRLIHEAMVPFYYLRLLRLPEAYGAVCIGSLTDFSLSGCGYWQRGKDGSLHPYPTPEEEGIELKTREDALLARARRIVGNPGELFLSESKAIDVVRVVEDWHADAAIIHINRGCKGMTLGRMEARRALQEKGIPTMLYESDRSDPEGFNETEVVGRWEAFMESLGLSRLD